MLLQNLHRRYLYITIKLPHLSDLEQRIPDFPNCDNNGSLHPSNSDPLLDETPTNDNKLHQVICNTFKIDYLQEMDIIIKMGTLQRIHRQYIRYESVLDNTLIGIEHLNSGDLTHHILEPRILARYLEAVEDDLEETAPAFEPVFTNVYQYYGNSLISFTNIIDDLLLQLLILLN